MSFKTIKKATGFAVPLSAVRTRKNAIIGEFSALSALLPFCKKSGFSIIQLLPVNDTGTQESPYSALSAFALNPIYISLDLISGFKKIYKENNEFAKSYDEFVKTYSLKLSKDINHFEYSKIYFAKCEFLKKIFLFDFEKNIMDENFLAWIEDNDWVKSYSIFKVLKDKYLQDSWKNWKKQDKKVNIAQKWENCDLSEKKNNFFYAWVQFVAFKQFSKVCDEIKKAKIILKGDLPILMTEDSCDAWENGSIFNHSLRAGSPPDMYNTNGQNWGFPIYNWKQLKKENYAWWKKRLAVASNFYGAYRLDHILGFFRIWASPENETTAMLGHTEPCVFTTKKELESLGFDEARICWLLEPHIPTSYIEEITQDYETAHKCLSVVADRIGFEELWKFKNTIVGDKDIYSSNFSQFCSGDKENFIKQKLCSIYLNRCFVKVEKDKYAFTWLYSDSTSWNSLNEDEKQKLNKLLDEQQKKQNVLWAKNAREILKELTSSSKMIPCGEDLGVNLECVPTVMKECDILALRVVRWCRDWNNSGLFVPMQDYEKFSVATTSVHDSSTLRQWWDGDKDEIKAFVLSDLKKFGIKKAKNCSLEQVVENFCQQEFNPKKALTILEKVANAKSLWCIHPLQDFLYLGKKYYLKDSFNERINIPGTVNSFNWAYMLPVYAEDLEQDEKLCEMIKKICKIHEE